jgi:glycosyltransferase involved in cell wall biosynthesis
MAITQNMISIIIPTYNEEKIIGILLKSLSEQDIAGELEVVVSDAFSKDKTREVSMGYAKYFSNFLIVDGGMPSVGRNNGAKASSGSILFFMDADLFVPEKDFVSKSAKYFREKGLGIATVYLKPQSDKIFDKMMMGFYSFVLYFSKYFRALGAMCIVADRKVFETAGGYPEDVIMNEDHDLMLKASKIGKYAVMPFSVYFPVRRFDKEGRLMLILKYAKATYYNLIFGPIKKPIFKYEFGGYEDNHKK